MDQPKVERLLRLMKYLSGNVNYSIAELSERLAMSERTIYRYLDTFKEAGFVVTKLYGNIYKLGKMPRNSVDIDKLIYFSEEEAYLVNSLIDSLIPSNSLKSNLKEKLSAIYGCTSVAGYVDRRSNAAHVENLGNAIKDKKQVLLKAYESSNSHSIRDRRVEAFAFTTDYIEVWCYDLEDSCNKLFKISRIGEVEVLEQPWTAESAHKSRNMDIFHMNGDTAHRVVLSLSMYAKNLLLEEYPLAQKDLRELNGRWILDTLIYNYAGICRFYVGLAPEIEIIESYEFQDYVRNYVRSNLAL